MKADGELKDALVFSVMADDIGLYEAYWEVQNGDIFDEDFGYSKEKSWENVAEIVIELIDLRFLILKYGIHSRNEPVLSNVEGILRTKRNWEPFDILDESGYFLGEGEETIARRLSGRSIRESFF